MRKLLVIFFCLISISLNATIYWVTPRGSDSNAGTDSSSTGAWLTWNYALNHTPSSDTCYFRGGIYPITSKAQLAGGSNDGTYSHPTCFFAYPDDWAAGNYPVLDGQSIVTIGDHNAGLSIINAQNIYVKGLTVKNIPQIAGWEAGIGFDIGGGTYLASNASNNIRFENCVAHNIGGMGFYTTYIDTAYYINCDAYNNCDSLTSYDPGGAGNGFGIYDGGYTSLTSYIYFHGCRAWKNSDQGMGISTLAKVDIDSCWSWNNGHFYLSTTTKGSGWKWALYNPTDQNLNVVQRVIRNCVVAYNQYNGFNAADGETNKPEVRAHIYNNFSYHNGYNRNTGLQYGYGFWDKINGVDTSGSWDHWYWNNISYDNAGYSPQTGTDGDIIPGILHQATNKWDYATSTISDADFESLDTTGMSGARQANGELPVIHFGHLAETSECINAGTDVGLPYNSTAPDIGWSEFIVPAPPTPPLVSTITPYNVNIKQGTGGGIVTYDGDFTVSERGVCWSTSADPEITDNYVSCGAGVEGATFTATITGLSSSTTYYVRAYATNGLPAYGANVSFTTPDWGVGWHEGKAVYHEGKIVIVK